MEANLLMGLKNMVIRECNVRGVQAEEIADDQQIIGGTGKLTLDSLDAVEIASALEKHFGIKLESAGASRQIFKSFVTMAEFVKQNAQAAQVESFMGKFASISPSANG